MSGLVDGVATSWGVTSPSVHPRHFHAFTIVSLLVAPPCPVFLMNLEHSPALFPFRAPVCIMLSPLSTTPTVLDRKRGNLYELVVPILVS
jgi:hypothetical protein